MSGRLPLYQNGPGSRRRVRTRQRDIALLQDRRGVQADIAMLLQTNRLGLKRAGRRGVHALQLAADIAIGVRLSVARITVRKDLIELREGRRAGGCEQRRSKRDFGLGHFETLLDVGSLVS